MTSPNVPPITRQRARELEARSNPDEQETSETVESTRQSADVVEDNPADIHYPRSRISQQPERTGHSERWESELRHLSSVMNAMMESVKQSQDKNAELIQKLIATQTSQQITTPIVVTAHRDANRQATPHVNSAPEGPFTVLSSKAKPRSPDEFSRCGIMVHQLYVSNTEKRADILLGRI